MVQWLRLRTPNAGGLGLIPGQGTRSPMLQLRPGQINIRYFLRVVFFLNSVKGHGDLLLALYIYLDCMSLVKFMKNDQHVILMKYPLS